MNEASLSRIINGTRQPAPEVREQIANALRESAEWLFQRSQVSKDQQLVGALKQY